MLPYQDIKILEPKDGEIVMGKVTIKIHVIDLSKYQPNHLSITGVNGIPLCGYAYHMSGERISPNPVGEI